MIIRERQRRNARGESGSALVATVLVSTALAAASAGVLCISLTGNGERRGTQENLRARYVCQAGLSNAVFDVQRGLSGALGSAEHPIEWGGAQYFVESTTLSGGLIQLTATGFEDRAGARMELVMREIPGASYRFGVFGHEFVSLDSNAHVDSYDSTTGTWIAQAVNDVGTNQHAESNGDVGSNGPITIEQNAKVWGDAVCGPNQTTTVLGNAVLTGAAVSAAQPQVMPTITLPQLPSLGNLTVNGNSTLPSGARRYGTLRVRANSTLTLTGPATLVCTNFQMDSNSSLRVDSSAGPLTLYVIDNFDLSQHAEISSLDHDPHDVELNLLADNVQNPETHVQVDHVDFESNSSIYGAVLAPTAAIDIDSNFALYGSLVARSVHLDSNSFIHFDESLNAMVSTGAPDWEILCWRTLPYVAP